MNGVINLTIENRQALLIAIKNLTWFTSCNSKSRETDLQVRFILTQKFHILSYLFQLQNNLNINYTIAGCPKDDLQLYIVLCSRPVFLDPLYHHHLRFSPFFYHHFCQRHSSSWMSWFLHHQGSYHASYR